MSATEDPKDDIVILEGARTPLGSFQGSLASLDAVDLGAAVVKATLERSHVAADQVEQIFMGCVLPAGLGQAPARQAALRAGLGEHVQASTINKVCGSGMQAAILAHDALRVGTADVIVAGGMESMTNAPYLLAKHRSGARIGHDVVKDSLYLDGLEDAYDAGRLMGSFGEDIARRYQFGRAEQDAYAIASLERAQAAARSGAFAREIVPVEVATRSGAETVVADEQPQRADPAKIPRLKPAFAPDGTITAANAASISDGAAAMVLTRRSLAEARGWTPDARIVAHAAHAHAPALFATAPIFAIRKVLDKAGWRVDDVDLFEINEAFAVVPMAAMKELGIPHEVVNVNGGACALGHPLGASGARVIVTLIAALKARSLKRGVASLCIGGGEATAMAVELT
ncbi:MAG TPA: acetyl-CoA C-acyltransferase [Caulobacteraceae bacterium]|jgi:acetyl-CoA C-acetyltransferase